VTTATPVLSDGRVELRPLQTRDLGAPLAAIEESKEVVGRWMGWCHPGFSEKDAADWIGSVAEGWAGGTAHEFGAFDASSGELLGCAGINQLNRVNNFGNIGYWVRTSRSRRGIATAIVRLLAAHGMRDVGLTRIEIVVRVENLASRRVAEKAGARLEGTCRNRLMYRDRPYDAVMYSLVPQDLP
jgi:RimJ/RimL family protein N-acetyltransferase